MYKVFIQNTAVIFVKSPTGFMADRIVYHEGFDFIELHENMKTIHPNGLEILCDRPKRAWKAFKSQFKIIKAGGGVVLNENDEILFIYRLDKWDLPKGKLDEGESIKQCAVREVEEECNLKRLELKQKICTTFHSYTGSKNYLIKKSYWYLMRVKGKQELIPQTEENITDVRWFDPNNLEEVKANTYEAIKEVIREMDLLNMRSKD